MIGTRAGREKEKQPLPVVFQRTAKVCQLVSRKNLRRNKRYKPSDRSELVFFEKNLRARPKPGRVRSPLKKHKKAL